MKKDYCKPTMNVVKIQHKCQILTGSNPTSVQTGLVSGIFTRPLRRTQPILRRVRLPAGEQRRKKFR